MYPYSRGFEAIPLELCFNRIEMVGVDVCIPERMDEFMWTEAALPGNKMQKKCITCNVERHT